MSAAIDRQNAAHQHLLDVLGALRRAIDDHDRRRGRHDIDDADERFLTHVTRESADCVKSAAPIAVKSSA